MTGVDAPFADRPPGIPARSFVHPDAPEGTHGGAGGALCAAGDVCASATAKRAILEAGADNATGTNADLTARSSSTAQAAGPPLSQVQVTHDGGSPL